MLYISVPEVLKSMEPVASHWQQHDALGADLVEGLRGQGATIYGKGNMSIDLTQTSYSTIPSVDMELGNAYSDHSDAILDQLAEGLLQGINVYFNSSKIGQSGNALIGDELQRNPSTAISSNSTRNKPKTPTIPRI